jgi:hypothetical protein
MVSTPCPQGDEPLPWFTWQEISPDGSFRFEALPQGTVEITAVGEGYISRQPGEFDGMVLKMEKAASVRVKVKDRDGVAMAKATVFFQTSETPRQRPNAGAGEELKTDDLLRLEPDKRGRPSHRRRRAKFLGWTDVNGTTLVGSLPVGKLKLRVVHPFPEYKTFWKDLELSPGETREVEITL